MSTPWFTRDDLLGDDQNEEEMENKYGTDNVIFLIDTHPSMFKPIDENGTTGFEAAMKYASYTYSKSVITNKNAKCGIVLFGTKKVQNQYSFPKIFTFHDLDQPSAERIKDIEEFTPEIEVNEVKDETVKDEVKNEDSLDADDFLQTQESQAVKSEEGITVKKENKFYKIYGESPDEPINFDEVLWTCGLMFVNQKAVLKSVAIITSRENPIGADRSILTKTKTRMNKLIEDGTEFNLYYINTKRKISSSQQEDVAMDGNDFNLKLFWDDVSEGEIMYNPITSAKEQELETFRKKSIQKRAISTVLFEITPGTKIAVSIYSLFRATTKGTAKKIRGTDNKLLKCETKNICVDTGEELDDNQIVHSYNYGGRPVYFEKEQLSQIKTLNNKFPHKGLKLLGFKDIKALKDYQNIKSANFIYPSEKHVKGSNKIFVTLLKKLVEVGKFALCRYKLRDIATPVLVALVPTNKKQNEDEDSYENEEEFERFGFHLIPLPYADNIREATFLTRPREIQDSMEQNNFVVEEVANDEEKQEENKMIETCKNFVDKLTFPSFNSDEIENPVVQTHYNTLKSLALEQQIVPVVDNTLPDYERFEQIKSEIKAFRDLFDYEDEAAPRKTNPRKRKRTVKKEEPVDDSQPKKKRRKTSKKTKAKKKKKEESSESESESDEESEEEVIDIVQMAQSGTLKKLTNNDLKDFLRMYKLKTTGTKKVLVERVMDYLRKRNKIE